MPSSSEKDVEGVQKFASYPLIPRPHIELGQQLGRGAYGSVYKGTWNNGDQSIVVAVKKVFMLEKE
uniref:Pkinase_Tyr domain-containing protein n=1 Tax=Steinernema glaseri TaxID=37863 RepID=A0A1I8AB35_9BILA